MTLTDSNLLAQRTLEQLQKVILGKEIQLKLALTCLLARGHLMIEDVPGVGKTTLAHALAATLGLEFARVQFTSDLLPSDVIGATIYERNAGTFRFHQGPIFTQLLLADEINRATPKTQSALLEAMEERQVSMDGQTHMLPEPFFVIATQNPVEQIGTFPLPESQLDRFLLTITLGYPDPRAERELLMGEDRRDLARHLPAVLHTEALQEAQDRVSRVHISAALVDYVQLLLKATRNHSEFQLGLSPRAALGLMSASRAWAWLSGRSSVRPEDIQAVFPALATHRLLLRSTGQPHRESVLALLASTPIP
ncbi:ATPase AAA [Deinococcus cellulosilyticus NBRC 106333 = KACC 11606]|uniref:ATPase AAA n=1 Tax=Deinococcus cellulosilyticus (strain DSM 18568 / NBRC 106333 / KACC 11606 / 5516J-15) TaxID=1223518 RepID=A0A511MW20_DEIC1|nr:MoxR family ATPase [Deinococcus cellulosilyticus]GEM44750.1 ATPase AAA [Deinococcus cellulosilyticus NBRC 106333 = KACC 11606]